MSAATTAAIAQQQNAAAKRSMQAARRSAAVTGPQIDAAASLEQAKNRLRSQQVIGRLRVAAAESGLAEDGSYLDLIRQADADTALNARIIDTNRTNQLARLSSGLDAELSSLSSRYLSPVLSAFQGGLSGTQAGLAIGGAIEDAGRPAPTVNTGSGTNTGNSP